MRYQGSHIDSYPAVATASVFLPDERKMKKKQKIKLKQREEMEETLCTTGIQ